MNMSDRTVNELDNAITRRFAMIELDSTREDKRRQLFKDWITTHVTDHTDLGETGLLRLFERDYQGINHGHESTSQDRLCVSAQCITATSPSSSVSAVEGGEYEYDQTDAVGQAFRTYIVPRLLNAAAFPQIERIAEHYRAMNGEFEEFDLSPAAELAEQELEQERRQMGSLRVMSTVDEVYEYGQDTFNVPERGRSNRGCPSSIGDQLRRASFTQEGPGVFTKSQSALDGEQEYRVVTVTVDGDENEILHVEATDIIGVVSLTPSSKVQVDPKIDWEHIFDMLLAVYDQNRSIEYHGIRSRTSSPTTSISTTSSSCWRSTTSTG